MSPPRALPSAPVQTRDGMHVSVVSLMKAVAESEPLEIGHAAFIVEFTVSDVGFDIVIGGIDDGEGQESKIQFSLYPKLI